MQVKGPDWVSASVSLSFGAEHSTVTHAGCSKLTCKTDKFRLCRLIELGEWPALTEILSTQPFLSLTRGVGNSGVA